MESLEVQRKQEISDLKAALLDATGGLLHDIDLHHHQLCTCMRSSPIDSAEQSI